MAERTMEAVEESGISSQTNSSAQENTKKSEHKNTTVEPENIPFPELIDPNVPQVI